MHTSPETPPPDLQQRRKFLQFLLGGSLAAWLGAVLYPIVSYLKPPAQAEVEISSVRVGVLDDIKKDGGQIVRFGSKPVLLIRTADGSLKAFSATCTHLDCTVQYRSDLGVIWCACHNGKYDLTGRNIDGPPPRPLDEFRVLLKGNEVYVAKKT